MLMADSAILVSPMMEKKGEMFGGNGGGGKKRFFFVTDSSDFFPRRSTNNHEFSLSNAVPIMFEGKRAAVEDTFRKAGLN